MRTARAIPRSICFAVAAFGVFTASSAARAQVANLPPTSASGWTFSITPYGWLPTLSMTASLTGPRGVTVGNTVSAGVGDYISKINYGLMLGGEARYDRFTIMTDLVYIDASLTTGDSSLGTVRIGSAAVPIPRALLAGTGTRLSTAIWSTAGGYTVLQGNWGNLDAVAGIRTLFLHDDTDYTLGAVLPTPDGAVALTKTGNLTLGISKIEGIGGVTGAINIPNSHFYLPFYLDAGSGSVPLTWEAYGAVAYQATSWSDFSLGYRYLTFANGSQTKGLKQLTLKGVIFAANFRF